MNKRIDFIILGSMKCGTTYLSAILADHPKINFCKVKEPHFFAKNPNWQQSIDEYHSLFQFEDGMLTAEASTSFTKNLGDTKVLAKTLKAYNPDLKFIYLMRNPMERYVSHYVHSKERAFTSASLENSLSEAPDILETGYYYKQLQIYFEYFEKEAFFIDTLENLSNDENQFLDRLYQFLEIEIELPNKMPSTYRNKGSEAFRIPNQFDGIINKLRTISGWAPKGVKSIVKQFILFIVGKKIEQRPELSEGMKKKLYGYYQKDLKELSTLLNRDFNYLLPPL